MEPLHQFHKQPATLMMPAIPEGSFEKKLYSMYLSYLPAEKVAFDLEMKCDERGSFTELLKTRITAVFGEYQPAGCDEGAALA